MNSTSRSLSIVCRISLSSRLLVMTTKRQTSNIINHFNEDFLAKLQCPLSKGKLVYILEKNEVISPTARIAFPIHSATGVLNLCPHDARVLAENEYLDLQ